MKMTSISEPNQKSLYVDIIAFVLEKSCGELDRREATISRKYRYETLTTNERRVNDRMQVLLQDHLW